MNGSPEQPDRPLRPSLTYQVSDPAALEAEVKRVKEREREIDKIIQRRASGREQPEPKHEDERDRKEGAWLERQFIVVGKEVGGGRRRSLRRITVFGIVAQQLAAVTVLEVVSDGIQEFKELSHGLGVEISGRPVQAQRAGRITHDSAPGARIRDAVRRGRAAGGRG